MQCATSISSSRASRIPNRRCTTASSTPCASSSRSKRISLTRLSFRLDTHGVVKRVAELFNGQPDLIEGFNTFLPLPYHLRADERSTTLTEPNGTEISFPAEPQLPSVPATEVTVSDVGSPISTPHRLWEAENPFNDPSRPPSPVVNYPALEPVRVASPIAEPSPSTTNYQRFSQVWNPGFSRVSDFAPRRSSPPPLVPDVANPFEDTESVPYLTPAEARAHFHGLDDFLKGYGAEEAEFNYMQPKPMPAPVPADASWSQWIPTPQPISRTPVDEAAERLYRQAVEEVEKEFELQRQQSEGEASSTSRDKGKRKMTQQEVRKLFEKEQNEVELEDVESDDKKRRTMSQDEVRRLFEQVPERSSPKLEEAPLPSPVLSPSLSPSPVPSPAPTAANPLAYATSSLFSVDPTWLPPISSSTSSSLNFSDLVARATEQLFPSVPQTEPVDSTMILPVEARTMEPEALPTTEDASRVPSVKASMPATFESANLSDSPTAAAPAATADLVATFISNNNIEDGHVFPAGAEFVKSWLMANEGTVAWPEATKLVYVAGFRMGNENAPMSYDIGVVAPGDRADVIVSDMKAPELPGHYIGFWRLSDGEGNFFGHRVWCDIVVTEPESSDSDDSLAASSVIMPAAAASLVATTVTEDAQSEIDAQTDAPTTPTVDSEIDTDSDASILDLSDDSDSEDDWDAGRRAHPQSSHGSSTLTVNNNTNNGNTTTTTTNNNNNRTGEQVEYVVLYDSASSADEA
ncbi:hypothetical protein BKA62DRAFT_691031 [Auriculariales sp. MPI-PUGE-AT-0066]|nr:hypothetical protein BKA62DRAFT_691031 [Auriculariales sp. MPI-PUGE-AT-0066]